MTEPTNPLSGKPEINPKNKNKKLARPLVDLLLEISMQADDSEKAVKAFDEIINRFQNYLEYACRRALFQYREHDESDLKTLLNNTFLQLYKKAEQLLHIDSLKTENEKEAVVKKWLGIVAGHEAARMNKASKEYYKSANLTDFNTYTKSTGNNGNEDDEDQDPVLYRIADSDDETESLTTDEKIIFTEVLNECTPREREIILTYYEFLDGRKHLPPDEVNRLCSMFNILPDNLNHIKYRTFKRIKSECFRRMEMRNPGYRIRE